MPADTGNRSRRFDRAERARDSQGCRAARDANVLHAQKEARCTTPYKNLKKLAQVLGRCRGIFPIMIFHGVFGIPLLLARGGSGASGANSAEKWRREFRGVSADGVRLPNSQSSRGAEENCKTGGSQGSGPPKLQGRSHAGNAENAARRTAVLFWTASGRQPSRGRSFIAVLRRSPRLGATCTSPRPSARRRVRPFCSERFRDGFWGGTRALHGDAPRSMVPRTAGSFTDSSRGTPPMFRQPLSSDVLARRPRCSSLWWQGSSMRGTTSPPRRRARLLNRVRSILTVAGRAGRQEKEKRSEEWGGTVNRPRSFVAECEWRAVGRTVTLRQPVGREHADDAP